MAVKIQAREIVRHAKRNDLKLMRMATGNENRHCARSAVFHMVFGNKINKNDYTNYWNMYDERPEILNKIGLTYNELESLEAGFEKNLFVSWFDKRYYKMGERVAELAGLNT